MGPPARSPTGTSLHVRVSGWSLDRAQGDPRRDLVATAKATTPVETGTQILDQGPIETNRPGEASQLAHRGGMALLSFRLESICGKSTDPCSQAHHHHPQGDQGYSGAVVIECHTTDEVDGETSTTSQNEAPHGPGSKTPLPFTPRPHGPGLAPCSIRGLAWRQEVDDPRTLATIPGGPGQARDNMAPSVPRVGGSEDLGRWS